MPDSKQSTNSNPPGDHHLLKNNVNPFIDAPDRVEVQQSNGTKLVVHLPKAVEAVVQLIGDGALVVAKAFNGDDHESRNRTHGEDEDVETIELRTLWSALD